MRLGFVGMCTRDGMILFSLMGNAMGGIGVFDLMFFFL